MRLGFTRFLCTFLIPFATFASVSRLVLGGSLWELPSAFVAAAAVAFRINGPSVLPRSIHQ